MTPEQMQELRKEILEADMTPALTIIKLQDGKCFAPDGRLAIYPDWLGQELINQAVKVGLLTQRFYKNLYGHTELYLNTTRN